MIKTRLQYNKQYGNYTVITVITDEEVRIRHGTTLEKNQAQYLGQ